VYDFLLLLDADMMALNTVDDLFSIFDKKVWKRKNTFWYFF
jgi:hypothetical protein